MFYLKMYVYTSVAKIRHVHKVNVHNTNTGLILQKFSEENNISLDEISEYGVGRYLEDHWINI